MVRPSGRGTQIAVFSPIATCSAAINIGAKLILAQEKYLHIAQSEELWPSAECESIRLSDSTHVCSSDEVLWPQIGELHKQPSPGTKCKPSPIVANNAKIVVNSQTNAVRVRFKAVPIGYEKPIEIYYFILL
jgi:hypothetical protein